MRAKSWCLVAGAVAAVGAFGYRGLYMMWSKDALQEATQACYDAVPAMHRSNGSCEGSTLDSLSWRDQADLHQLQKRVQYEYSVVHSSSEGTIAVAVIAILLGALPWALSLGWRFLLARVSELSDAIRGTRRS